MLNDELVTKQLSDLEEKTERLATHLKDSMGFFEQMSRDLLAAESRITKIERIITGSADSRQNCPNCRRVITAANKRCEYCGTTAR